MSSHNRDDFQTQEAWKNRSRVTAKLPDRTYFRFVRWCREKGLSINSGIIHIITDFFQKP